jgi:AcrR family transcriptional regulator
VRNEDEDGEAMQPMTISQLERLSGVGRSTIYYYISEGLLPPAQKASATRAIYDARHLDLLREITELKATGLSLREIQERLASRIEAASENGIDLVARQNEVTRAAIVEAAARRFIEHGYEGTRINDVCRDVGITGQVLYSHFPSKRHLFIACYQVYFDWMNVQVAEPIERTDDSAARLAWRSWAGYGIQGFSPDMRAMAYLEASHPESELRPFVRQIHEKLLAGAAEELAGERAPAADNDLFDDELISYGLLGALELMQMRASWDATYSKQHVLRNLLAMFMAIRAAYRGRVDLTGDWAAVSDLVDGLAASSPHIGHRADETRS